MSKPEFKSVDEYIAAQPTAIHVILEQVRSAIRHALPQAEEVISYQMPTYKLHDQVVIHFAAWKRHYSLYAATAGALIAFKRELEPYEVIKGTIRFPLSQPVPVNLIERLAKFRAKQAAQRLIAKVAARKKR